MKQAFSEKPNPDSNDLKKLSNQTGLAKRVLQVIYFSYSLTMDEFAHYNFISKVWFQNARAKQRKVCQESESVAESEVSKVNVNETSRIELLKIDWS